MHLYLNSDMHVLVSMIEDLESQNGNVNCSHESVYFYLELFFLPMIVVSLFAHPSCAAIYHCISVLKN